MDAPPGDHQRHGLKAGRPVCPICLRSVEAVFSAKVNLAQDIDHDLVECISCGVLRCDPLPAVKELEWFYASSYYNFDRWRQERGGAAFAGQLKRWRKKGMFLDVGCAAGFFIHGIREHSAWEVYGIDFGESAVRYAREELDLEVRLGELTDAGYEGGYFDYIHINNVLEHVLDPVAMLRECRRIIKPDGRLCLSVPNGFNDSRELIDYYNEESRSAYSHKGHIYFFPANTLVGMFEQTGFRMLQRKSHGFKRGMQNLGRLPRKRNWKEAYHAPAESGQSARAKEVAIGGGKKRPGWYYRYRFFESNIKMLPGLHNSALDFMFLLRPK